MSGAAGGTRINKEDLKFTIRDYRDSILKPLGLDKSYNITGVRSRPEKNVFGDIDIVVSFPGGDKKELKQDLAKFLEHIEKIPTIAHKNNKKYFIHGNIVTILYPIFGKENEYVQIDNIVTASKEEGKFTFNMLDLPAQEQTLAIGLAKTIFTELDEKQIENLFKELGITNPEKPNEGEEYDFNLNPSELTLRIVPIGKNDGREIWKSNKFEDVKKLTSALGINIEKDKFDNIIPKIKKFKNRRSIDRLKGMFVRNIRVGDAEKGIEKGIKKQQAIDTVSTLEEKYSPLVMSLIFPFIKDETILLEEKQPETISLMPGAFKPPHRDHLRRINAAAQASDKAIILISPLDRAKDNETSISAKQSLAIWQLYKDKGVLAHNIEFLISPDNAPVKTAYDLVTSNPQNKYIGVYGKEDADRWKNLPNEKYPNLRASDFGIIADLSASGLRKALTNNEDITPWLPDGITPEEYKEALGIKSLDEWVPEPEIDNIDSYADDLLDPIDLEMPPHFVDRVNDRRNRPEIESDELYDFIDKLSDEKDELLNMLDNGEDIVATDSDTNINIPLTKDISKSKRRNQPVVVAKTIMRKQNFLSPDKKLTLEQPQEDISDDTYNLENNLEFKEKLVSLTLYMIEKGLNIEPLPDIIFIEDDEENANNILGRTAHYNPNDKSIALYTLGRHPKDILRSFAHEMIHHIQNIEGRIQGIEGQNINEDEYLKELEEEAYSKGNMCFRGWENSLNND
jgi:hypothetical protein